MEKYEKHALTRAQDDILGSFGDEGEDHDSILNYSISPEQREVVKQLIARDLLKAYIREDFSAKFRLTPKGRKLWRIRYEEESEGSQH